MMTYSQKIREELRKELEKSDSRALLIWFISTLILIFLYYILQ